MGRARLLAGTAIAASLTGTVVASTSDAEAPAGADEARNDAVVVSVGVVAPSAPFVAGDRVAYLEDGELLVWVDPSSPGDVDTLDVSSAVVDPVATADAIFIPALFSVTEIALDDGTEVAVYEGDWDASMLSLAVSDDAVAVGSFDRLDLFDRGSGALRWSIPAGGGEITSVTITPGAVFAELVIGGTPQVGGVAVETGEFYWNSGGVELDDVIVVDDANIAIASTSAGTDDQYLDLVDAAAGTGAWSLTFDDRIDTVALVDGTLVVTDEAPSLHFVDVADGSSIADVGLGARARHRAVAHPTLGMVTVDDTGTVDAFDPATGDPTIAPFAIGNAPASREPAGLGAASEVHGFVIDGDMLYVTLTGAGPESRLIGVDLTRL